MSETGGAAAEDTGSITSILRTKLLLDAEVTYCHLLQLQLL